MLMIERKARPAAFQKSKLGDELIELGIIPKRQIVDSKAAGKFDQIAGRDGAKESLRTAIGNLERQRKMPCSIGTPRSTAFYSLGQKVIKKF